MGWTQLRYRVTADDAEALAAILDAEGALSVTLEDAGDEPRYQGGAEPAPLWQAPWVVGLYSDRVAVDDVAARVRRAWPGSLPDPRVEPLADRQWELAWQDGFAPMRFGERLWVVPGWLDPPDPAAVNLRLDPGLAFGTGTHPTTALCLEWLEGTDLAGTTVIDYGCGSGILAVAALLLGAAAATATDVDPQALAATRANAARNGVAEALRVVEPAGVGAVAAPVVVANILAGPLVELAPTLAGLVAPGGRLVLSGLLEEQLPRVTAAYAARLTVTGTRTRTGWALLALERAAVAS